MQSPPPSLNVLRLIASHGRMTILFLCLGALLVAAAAAGAAKEGVPQQTATARTVEPHYSSVEERRLLMALQQDRKNLEHQRLQLEEKKKSLKRLEAEVDKKLDQMKRLRLHLEELLAQKKRAEQQRILNLSKMYAKMNPEKAARLLSTVDQDLAVAVIEKMKIKAAAKILDHLDKKTAVRLSTAFSRLEPPSSQ